MTRMLALLSGGMDSTVLVGHLLDLGHDVAAVSVDYGQRHRVELSAAARVAAHYGVRHDVIDLAALGRLLGGSALTDDHVEVPLGHYADPAMRATVVPNRNAIMIMCAAGIAAARGYNIVATAVHAGDHPIYPDCRPEFITAADLTVRAATTGYGDVGVLAPFVHHDKAWIVVHGTKLGAPLDLTWSCYQGDTGGDDGLSHCGRCGTCVERREAFTLAGLVDPTGYADPAGAR